MAKCEGSNEHIQHHHVPHPWEYFKGSSPTATLEQFLEEDNVPSPPTKHPRKRHSLFPSISARDLTCFNRTEKEERESEEATPKGVLDANLRGTLDSDSISDSDSPRNGKPKRRVVRTCASSRTGMNWKRFFGLWKKRSIQRLTSFTPAGVPKLTKKSSGSGEQVPLALKEFLSNFEKPLKEFSLVELQLATNNFSRENLIGRGGFSEVYKGSLPDGELIAVKRLTEGTPDEKTTEFLSELGIIAHVDHPNTAKLTGSGVEGGMHLIFKLSEQGSLGSILHSSRGKLLDWSRRYKIALGIADGLLYLHEDCKKRIIHRDIKAENILLTEDFEPQICDFGLAKWLPKHWSHHNVSKFEGTFGYFAPEYFMHGIVDEKTDVYAFGVLLLELITGRQALDDSQKSVVIWAKPLLDNNNIKELMDDALGDMYDSEEVDRVAMTASLCIEQSSILRPRMSQVVVLLRGEAYIEEFMKNCKISKSYHRTYSEESLDVQEYNSTKYLKDLDQHRQVALGY